MTIQDFIIQRSENYTPRTPFTAIRAFETGILPIEHFIYKSTSSLSLDEESTDLDLIERVLSMQKLDIYAHLLLFQILEKLINNPDQEIALFAAESINLIESRYNEKIEAVKEELKDNADPLRRVILARLYYELALLNYKKVSIRTFYFMEAYQNFKDMVSLEKISMEDLEILVEILIELKQSDHAISILNHLNKDDNVFLLYLTAKVEFERKNYTRVYNTLSGIFKYKEQLNAKLGNICSYWMDSPWIERSEFVS